MLKKIERILNCMLTKMGFFPTFLKSGQGPVEFGKKAFGSSNWEN